MAKLRHPLTVSTYLTVFFCTLYSFVIISDNLPNSALKQSIRLVTQPIVESLGIWQRWDMFNGGQAEIRARYVYTVQDDSIQVGKTAVTDRAPLLPSIYINTDYSVVSQSVTSHAEALAKYQCKNVFATQGILPKKVQLQVAKAPVPRLYQSPITDNLFTSEKAYTPVATVTCL